MQKPSVGRIVHAVLPSQVNGTDLAPAVITRVWSEREDGSWTVNLSVLPDATAAVYVMTSARLCEDEETARASGQAFTAFWPPRA